VFYAKIDQQYQPTNISTSSNQSYGCETGQGSGSRTGQATENAGATYAEVTRYWL